MKLKSILLLIILSICMSLTVYAQSNADITTFILVRHAEKVDDSADPDLSPEGYARAERLAEMLQNVEIDAIYSTDRIRTMETVRLDAEKNELVIENYDAGEPDENSRLWLEKHTGETVLISGHSNTTPFFANALLGYEYYPDKFDESDYGNLLIITVAPDGSRKIVPLRY